MEWRRDEAWAGALRVAARHTSAWLGRNHVARERGWRYRRPAAKLELRITFGREFRAARPVDARKNYRTRNGRPCPEHRRSPLLPPQPNARAAASASAPAKPKRSHRARYPATARSLCGDWQRGSGGKVRSCTGNCERPRGETPTAAQFCKSRGPPRGSDASITVLLVRSIVPNT